MVNSIRVLFVGSVIGRERRRHAGQTVAGYRPGCLLKLRTRRLPPSASGRRILVTRNLDMSFVPLLRLVNGLVIEQPTELSSEILSMINPSLVWVSQVSRAMKVLEPGLTVTLDSREKIVYEGTV